MARRRRSPARFLAPLALAGVIAAGVVIVNGSRDDGNDGGSTPHSSTTRSTTTHSSTTTTSTAGTTTTPATSGATETVRPGDSPASIAARTGTTVDKLEAANPGVSPTALKVGQKLKLPAGAKAP